VLQFRGDFRAASLRHVIAASNADDPSRPLSLYVHVPFCSSPCFYCGCNRVITHDLRRADQYVVWLQREAAWLAPLFGPERRVSQIHMGGGTPNFLNLDQMHSLMDCLAQRFRFDREEGREFAIEIDPRYAEDEYVRELAQLGFNRMSLDIQDFDPRVQQAVNRTHTAQFSRVLHAWGLRYRRSWCQCDKPHRQYLQPERA
jgi:oxygen-independent coproporphyrinogen-3 oxidase